MKTWRKKTGKKKGKLSEPDEFQSLTQMAVAYVKAHARQAYYVLGVMGVAIVLTILVAMLLETSRKNVVAMQAQALQYYDLNSPMPGNKPLTPTERMKKAREMFNEIVEKHGGSPAADKAIYYRANADMELDNIDSAITGYKSLLDKASGNPVLVSLASQRLAEAYLAKGDDKDAINVYKGIINLKDGYLKDKAHYSLAKIFEEAGNKEMALMEYRTIQKKFPNSPWLAEARNKVVELGGVAEQAGTPGPGVAAIAPGAQAPKK